MILGNGIIFVNHVDKKNRMTVINFWPSWITWLPEEKRKDELFRLIRSGEKVTTGRPTFRKGEYYQLYYGKRGDKKELIAEVEAKTFSILELNPVDKTMSFEGCFLTSSAVKRTIEDDGFKGHIDAFWDYFSKPCIVVFHEWEKPVKREKTGGALNSRSNHEK
jgi:hypothetical protein